MVLVINPGSTSTKVALYDGEHQVAVQSISHPAAELAHYAHVPEQLEMRTQAVAAFLAGQHVEVSSLEAIMARGGLIHPVAAGVYRVNAAMLHDCNEGAVHEHASNLGAMIADRLAQGTGVPCYIADPVAVDEFDDIARISGLKELPRQSLLHALNVRRVAFNVARAHGKALADMNMVVAHLGGGFSIVPMRHGRMVDVNNADDGGPYSPERTGTMPAVSLVQLSFAEGASEESVTRQLIHAGGLVSHLGTNSAREVEQRIAAGDAEAALVFEGMAYQIAKEIGAMATVLEGDVDVIVITGGLANSTMLVDWITRRVGFIAPVEVVPGEDELDALNDAFLRLKQGTEVEKVYR